MGRDGWVILEKNDEQLPPSQTWVICGMVYGIGHWVCHIRWTILLLHLGDPQSPESSPNSGNRTVLLHTTTVIPSPQY